MNAPVGNISPQQRDSDFRSRFLFLCCCLLPILAITGQSCWIDEALTAFKASSPTLTVWWERMVTEKASDLQMPLYMVVTWFVAQIGGTDEWVLRAANLPWFVGGLMVFAFSFKGGRRNLAALLAALSPFAWFYLDEARPYAMQLGASFCIAGALRKLVRADESCAQRKWVIAFAAGIAVLAGTSLLGVLWCAAAVLMLTLLCGVRRMFMLGSQSRGFVAFTSVWLVVLAAHYVWTLKVGARASAMATTNWQSPLFVVYELAGFAGLGPGRLDIRTGGLASFKPYLVVLGMFAVTTGAVIFFGIKNLWRQDRRTVCIAALVCGGAFAALIVAGVATHFRVLGRHCAPLSPLLVLLLVEGLWGLNRMRRLAMVLLISALAASCVSTRFASRHLKDDYRAAAGYARTAVADGKTVWWSADGKAAAFYGLKVDANPPDNNTARLVLNPDAASLAAVDLPDVAVISKPDIYDAHGAMALRLRENGFVEVAQFPAFRVLVRPAR